MTDKPLRIKDRVEYLDGFAYIDEDVKSAKRLLKQKVKETITFSKRYNYDVNLVTIGDIMDACFQIDDNEATKAKKEDLVKFNKLSFRQKWEESRKLESVIWCCAKCKHIIDEGKLPKKMLFMGERYCGNCDSLLTRRTGGGQSDPFNYIPKKKGDDKE